MANDRRARRVRFGPFEIDLKAGYLQKDGVRILLSEQLFRILRALVENPGELVTRSQIRRRLWQNGTTVEFDHSINAAIARLRNLLEDNVSRPVYIETIPRRGYRFIAPVSDVSHERAASPTLVAGREESWNSWAPVEAIAVLPFGNTGNDPESEYLSDGITESLINCLSRMNRLKVVARSTVFRFKGQIDNPAETGRKLNVPWVLTGRVLKHGQVLTVGAELVDVHSGWQLWGERYRLDFTDIFDVQEQIARAIFQKLCLQLSPKEEQQLAKRYTQNTKAYELYLKGLFFWNKWSPESLRRAETFFRRAIEEDPAYAPAYAGLADCLSVPRYLGLISPIQVMEKVGRIVEKALALDDSLPLAWWVLGISALLYRWNWAEAEKAFHRAVEVSPSDAWGYVGLGYAFAVQGRFNEGIEWMLRGTKLDPLSPIWTYGAGMIYHWMGKDTEARDQLGQSLEIEPKFLVSRLVLGKVYATAGRLKDAILEFEQAARDSDDHPYALGYLGYAYATLGHREQMEKILSRLRELSAQKYVPPLAMALVYLGARDWDSAFCWLNRAVDEREPRMTHLKVDPFYKPLRSDDRFQKLICRIGLPS